MNLTRTEAAELLLRQDPITILTHRRPDGDTLGCAALLCLGLRQLGKTCHILRNPEITEKYEPLHQGLTREMPGDGDFLVAVDTAAPHLLPERFQSLVPRIGLRIDHHGSGESFAPMELVDPSAAACGEILYDLLTILGVRLTVPMADALYTAVSTDTGCFRYANTTANTLRVAAACADVSNHLARINQELFETVTRGRLRLQGWMMEHAVFLRNGEAVVCAIPRAVEKQLELKEDDLENISGFPRTIEGVQVAATLRETRNGKVKISVRALPGFDAAALCEGFGGGGHAGAAGAVTELPLEEAARQVGLAMEKME